MMGPAISALISRRTQGGQGLNLSVQQSFDALARTVGPLTAGWLFKTFDPTAPYYFSAGLTVFALLLTVAVPSILAAPKDPEQAK
jgi:MFS family permease